METAYSYLCVHEAPATYVVGCVGYRDRCAKTADVAPAISMKPEILRFIYALRSIFPDPGLMKENLRRYELPSCNLLRTAPRL